MTLFVIIVAMLSIAALGNTDYHARLAQEDYYDPEKSGERPGTFIGRGAALLGLRGIVSRVLFKSLMKGVDPVTRKPLRKNAGRRNEKSAFDLVLSPFKSFSVAWALTADNLIRGKLEDAFQAAVAECVERIEGATFSRVGRRGRPVPAKPIISSFFHSTSRARDPQCHNHLVVKNVAVREDGSTGAIMSRPYYVRKMAWGCVISMRLDL